MGLSTCGLTYTRGLAPSNIDLSVPVAFLLSILCVHVLLSWLFLFSLFSLNICNDSSLVNSLAGLLDLRDIGW